jgi:hypothetical protein
MRLAASLREAFRAATAIVLSDISRADGRRSCHDQNSFGLHAIIFSFSIIKPLPYHATRRIGGPDGSILLPPKILSPLSHNDRASNRARMLPACFLRVPFFSVRLPFRVLLFLGYSDGSQERSETPLPLPECGEALDEGREP